MKEKDYAGLTAREKVLLSGEWASSKDATEMLGMFANLSLDVTGWESHLICCEAAREAEKSIPASEREDYVKVVNWFCRLVEPKHGVPGGEAGRAEAARNYALASSPDRPVHIIEALARMSPGACVWAAARMREQLFSPHSASYVIDRETLASLADAVRDIVGPPRIGLGAGDEIRLPEGVFEGMIARDPLAFLAAADAIEDAGIADGGLLKHLRSGRRHWNGCWAVRFIEGGC